MSAAWAWVVLAVLAANLPFMSSRLMGLWSLPRPKTLVWRLIELLFVYALLLGMGLWYESRTGQVAAQRWEFYAVTACLFLTFAFPGFVVRYLLRRTS